MRQFIFAARNGIYIVDLEKTKERLEAAAAYAEEIAARGGSIMFIGTKRQAKPIIEREAKRAGAAYVTNRWIGGTFTNFPTISRVISTYKRLLGERERGELQKYTKKERVQIDKEIVRLESMVGGIAELAKLPDAVFVVDLKQERTAIKEARKTGVPIIGIVDTNVNPTGINYPIPANDDATKSIELIVTAIADAIEEGRGRFEKSTIAAEEAQAKEAKKAKDALIPAAETTPVAVEE
jgi:small subunit ribosomal protein S2